MLTTELESQYKPRADADPRGRAGWPQPRKGDQHSSRRVVASRELPGRVLFSAVQYRALPPLAPSLHASYSTVLENVDLPDQIVPAVPVPVTVIMEPPYNDSWRNPKLFSEHFDIACRL